MRRWRENHPILATWHIHIANAKQRGIPVEWTKEEFYHFCECTGYHFLRKDGWTIDRIDATRGYSLVNCDLLKNEDNARKGYFERKFSRHFRRGVTNK